MCWGGEELREDITTIEHSPLVFNPQRALRYTFTTLVVRDRVMLFL